jgi:hypothetical protein
MQEHSNGGSSEVCDFRWAGQLVPSSRVSQFVSVQRTEPTFKVNILNHWRLYHVGTSQTFGELKEFKFRLKLSNQDIEQLHFLDSTSTCAGAYFASRVNINNSSEVRHWTTVDLLTLSTYW